MQLMTYKEIYEKLKEDKGHEFTLYKLLTIFRDENSWIGKPEQLMELKEIVTNITGVRPGSCSGCMINVLVDMNRWLYNYEKDNPINPEPIEEKKKVGRPKQNQ